MSNDLISREWLEDAFDNLCCHNCKMCRNFRIEDSFYKCALIDNTPTVEERPKGKWELFEKRPYHNLYMCSNCGHIIESMPDRLAENFKGCYCGADMRGDV